MPVAGLLVFELVFLSCACACSCELAVGLVAVFRFFSFSWLVFLAAHVVRKYVVALLRILYRRPTTTLRTITQSGDHQPPTGVIYRLSPRSEIHKVHDEPFL